MKSLLRRLRFALFYAIFLLVLLELTCRVFWALSGVPLVSCPNRLHDFFYPELAPLGAREIRRGDGVFDILLLGGSVLDPRFHDIGGQLENDLAHATSEPVRVHVVARPSHTTLDSRYKYRHLAQARFDLVILYHGINEARANNCPSEMFRDDYSHWGWCRLVNAYERGGDRLLVLPYTLYFVWIKAAGKLGLLALVPKHEPEAEWRRFGSDIKTERPFRANVQAIADIARERGDPLLLLTFAIHVPPGYTREKFEAGNVDYAEPGTSGLPIELWGDPAAIRRAIDAHNRIVREIAATNEHVRLLDMARRIPAKGRFYEDVCHLSKEGSELFVAEVVRAIRSR